MNRQREIAALERWWTTGPSIAMVWGRRRVGKTVLLAEFAGDKPTAHHVGANRAVADELRELSRAVTRSGVQAGLRDLVARPFTDWTDALETLAAAAADNPLLIVLDEFSEMAAADPSLESTLRAVWERVRGSTQLRIVLCGSAVRSMEAMQEQRSPLYGRVDLALQLHPFDPSEAAQMLPRSSPVDRAIAWGVTGGMPLYLSWWDQGTSAGANVRRLLCEPTGALKSEGDLVVATEGLDASRGAHLPGQLLRAIAGGRTKFHELRDVVRTDPTRTLASLIELRLVERVTPVTEKSSRRGYYRVGDNFLAFWLKAIDPRTSEIDRGLGGTIAKVVLSELDDHMGGVWEEAARRHVRRLATSGEFGDDVVAVGPFWTEDSDPVEIDIVVLAGRARRAIGVGEAKWGRTVDGSRQATRLLRAATRLPRTADELKVILAVRERLTRPPTEATLLTAADIFAPSADAWETVA